MKNITLTKKEKRILEARHRKTRNVRELDRIKAVLLRSEDWTISAIAQALRVHESTIARHIEDYVKEEKLTLNKGGSDSFLSAEQTEALLSHLYRKTIPSYP